MPRAFLSHHCPSNAAAAASIRAISARQIAPKSLAKYSLAALAAHRGTTEMPVRQFAYAVGLETARDVRLLVGDTASASTAIRTLENWAVPVLPVKGRDVIMHGVSAGPDVARILKSVEKAWVEEDFPDRPRALELVDQMIGRSSD